MERVETFTGHELFRVKPGSHYDGPRWKKQQGPHGNLKLLVIDGMSGNRCMFLSEYYRGNIVLVDSATPDMPIDFGGADGSVATQGDAALVSEGEQRVVSPPATAPVPPKIEPKQSKTKRKPGRPAKASTRKPK